MPTELSKWRITEKQIIMNIGLIISYTSAFLLILPIIIGALKIRSLDSRERIFYAFIVIDFIFMWISHFTSNIGNNMYVFHILALINLSFLTIVFIPPHPSKKFKLILSFSIVIVLLSAFYEAFVTKNGLTYFNSLTFTASGVVILVLAINKLMKVRQNELTFDISKEPFFWFAFSIALLYSAGIVTVTFQKYLQDISINALWTIIIIQQSVHFIAIIGYTKGLSLIKNHRTKEA